MRTIVAPARALAVAFFCLVGPLGAAVPYRFALDGKEFDPRILPVNGKRKGDLAPGDVGFADGYRFVLQQPGHYQFRAGGEEGSRLFCRIDDGPERCVGVRVATSDEKTNGEYPLIDPLLAMSDEAKRALWSVDIEDAPDDWNKSLAGIDWNKTALALHFSSLPNDSASLPVLPAALQYLSININGSPSLTDFSTLEALTELRFLEISLFGTTLDLSHLTKARHLRNFSLSGGAVENPDSLGALTSMRFLKLRSTDDLDSVAFARTMPDLRVLKVDQSPVTDLRPVAACPELRLLSATSTAVTHLPPGASLPALRDLRLLSTPLAQDEEQLAVFRKAAPQCDVKARWHVTLLAKLADANRLRVRSGGTCHRDPEREQTLFVVEDPGKIEALVKSLEINEERSGFHCMCCGDPSLEFYQGDQLLLTLGFHHGQSLRWSDGLWPGDAAITLDSAELLCDLMADEGYDEPQKELQEQKASQQAQQRYWDAVLEIAPESWVQAFWELTGDEFDAPPEDGEETIPVAVAELLRKQWPEEATRAAKLFALYGAVPAQSWNLSTGLDNKLRDHVLESHAGFVPSLLANAAGNARVMQGIARWCLFDREGKPTRSALTADQLNQLIQWSLRHPRPANRIQALLALDSDRGETTLLEFLKEPPVLRLISPEAEEEPGGQVTYLPRGLDIPGEATPREVAALLLAKRNCLKARDPIQRLAPGAPGDRPNLYEKALEQFKELPGR